MPKKQTDTTISLTPVQASAVRGVLNEAIKHEQAHSMRCTYRKILSKLPLDVVESDDDTTKKVQQFVAMLCALHQCFDFSDVELQLHRPTQAWVSTSNSGTLLLGSSVMLSFDVSCNLDCWEIDFAELAQVTGLALHEGAAVYRFLNDDNEMLDLSGSSVLKVTKFKFKYSDSDLIKKVIAQNCGQDKLRPFEIAIYGD